MPEDDPRSPPAAPVTGIPVVRYSRERLPLADGPGALPPDEWPRWTTPTPVIGGVRRAVRIVGAFEVECAGQVSTCADGWLALDPHGNPYPISVEEFRRYGRWQPEPEE